MSDLIGNPEDRFFRVAAHFRMLGFIYPYVVTVIIIELCAIY